MFVDVKSLTAKENFSEKISKLKENQKIRKVVAEPKNKSTFRMPTIKISNRPTNDYNDEFVYTEYKKSIETIVLGTVNNLTFKSDSLIDKMYNSRDLRHGIMSLSGVTGNVTSDLIGVGLTLGSILVQHSIENKTSQPIRVEEVTACEPIEI